MIRQLPESKLYPPVRDWLEAQGFRVFPEAWGHDVVAHLDERIVTVEMKTSFTKTLVRQLMYAAWFSDQVYAAVPSMPRPLSIERCKRFGFGLLVVGDGGCAAVVDPVAKCGYLQPEKHARTLTALRTWTPDTDKIAGLPTLAGDGPAQKCLTAVEAYIQLHPNAPWRDIFLAVPNHYAHAASMRQALGKAAIRAAEKAGGVA